MVGGLVRSPPQASGGGGAGGGGGSQQPPPPPTHQSAPPQPPLGAGYQLLPPSGNLRQPGDPFTPQAQGNGKRPRVDSPPEHNRQVGAQAAALVTAVANTMNVIKGKIGTAALDMQNTEYRSIKDLKGKWCGFMSEELVSIFELQANVISDLAAKVGSLEATIAHLSGSTVEMREDIACVKQSKDRAEVKTSCKDMEQKVKVAVTQFKVLDLDMGTGHKDRRELTEAARKALNDKVRTDLRTDFNDRIRRAVVTVLARQTTMRRKDNKDIWTAPVLVQIEDRETRWGAEDALRKSNVHPTFHWPREMMEDVKEYRKKIQDMGYGEDSHYIRIRPEERDNTWRIKAEVKRKDSQDRFKAVANFAIPPLDSGIRELGQDWYKPTWTLVVRNRTRSMLRQARRASQASASGQDTFMDAQDSQDLDDEVLHYNI